MKRTVIAALTALVVAASAVTGFGATLSAASASSAVSAATTSSAASEVSASALTAVSPVTGDPQQLAKVIVAAHNAGNFSTDPTSIYDREVAPVASGQVISGCAVDVRILQVIVLTLNRFGSLRVSDLERPCIGSSLNCGPPTYSVHCLNPGEAIDFANVGGVGLDGNNTQTRNLLSYLDFFVPPGTNAGQQECRSNNPLPLNNINQFSDTCNHQHLDFRNTNAPLSASALATILPSLSQASAYVTLLYNDYLNRVPSSDEVRGWAVQLANGSPRSSVSDGFVNSDEYRLIRITNAYRTVLGRSPDAPGEQNWLDGMHKGLLTTDDVDKSFYASDEYYAQHGGTDLGFVTSLYQTLLHRSAGSSEYAFWTNLVAQYGRTWVITQFWSSTETISERISLMYQKYLGRVPDPGGLQHWVGLALQIGDSGLRSALTSSDEYWAIAQAGAGSRASISPQAVAQTAPQLAPAPVAPTPIAPPPAAPTSTTPTPVTPTPVTPTPSPVTPSPLASPPTPKPTSTPSPTPSTATPPPAAPASVAPTPSVPPKSTPSAAPK
ncbi:DUF4214 domain-containing protein [Subtercola lobariae]|uniref:DUF4214 domain-containing protein n=1 Tax=Subtercola lobariae TaxID=1588641 RepID=A0A917AYY8_9MICO|nr:DUF4214 domain-containing protein [Subtercola lobariae]GGF11461.1 hypothetical protein GCM10011399_01640 [Subtercola lobariae]